MWYEFLLFAIILLLIDIPWLLLVMKKIYSKVFKIEKTNYIAAGIAYILLILTFFAIYDSKNSSNNSICNKLKRAALIGAIVYGVYGMTLASFYHKYPISIALVETGWGIILLSLTTAIAHYVRKLL